MVANRQAKPASPFVRLVSGANRFYCLRRRRISPSMIKPPPATAYKLGSEMGRPTSLAAVSAIIAHTSPNRPTTAGLDRLRM
jgi:hypothetical protein